jgi:uncharacterized membrane protein (DUF485 family)
MAGGAGRFYAPGPCGKMAAGTGPDRPVSSGRLPALPPVLHKWSSGGLALSRHLGSSAWPEYSGNQEIDRPGLGEDKSDFSCFAWAVTAWLVSPWFVLAAVWTWATGWLMIYRIHDAYLIYGIGWSVLLWIIAAILQQKSRRNFNN